MSTELYTCSICNSNQPLVAKFQLDISETKKPNLIWLSKLGCGHSDSDPKIVIDSLDSRIDALESLDGKKPFGFQKQGIKWLFENNVRGLIADEMGLGKTIQAVLTCFLAYQDGLIKNPLVITKAAVKRQFGREFVRWTKAEMLAQVISSPKQKPIEGTVTVISYDLTWRIDWDDEIWDSFDCIILDEVQMMKRSATESKRAKFILEKVMNCKHIIELSGTPFKNTLYEYFNALHMLRPERFPTLKNFIWRYVDYYMKGTQVKYMGLKKSSADLFEYNTKDIVLRRTVDEVMPDMPKYQDNFRYSDLQDKYRKAYNDQYEAFLEAYSQNDAQTFGGFNNILQYITAMRQITSLSKVESTVELTCDYLMNNDEKITIFYHHHLTGRMLYNQLADWCKAGGYELPLEYTSDLNDAQRDKVVQDFEKGNSRILLASTLAGGEGINLQFCRRMILHERQWNPANEDQAKGRFRRIGSVYDKIFVDFMIAAGTIDDFFTELVEKKRSGFKSAMDGEFTNWQESDLMKELFAVLAAKSIKQWRL
jgi:SNF2 family DNA or RNA helicase